MAEHCPPPQIGEHRVYTVILTSCELYNVSRMKVLDRRARKSVGLRFLRPLRCVENTHFGVL